jgi:lipopolysaccharide/colanic/teichoic acid biosynthesis glycosyltransferase
MSFVGPRPEVQEFINMYPVDVKNKILSIKPGITDMASIEMANESDILEKYKNPKQAYIDIILPIKQKHYLKYVDNHNMWFDIKIIFLTIKKITVR